MPSYIETDTVQQLIREVLARNAAVSSAVGNRIVGGYLRDADWGTLVKPAVAIVLGGGSVHYTGTIGSLPVEIWAMSGQSEGEARKLYTKVFAVLQAGDLYIDGLDHRGVAWEQEQPVLGWYEAGATWYCRGRWLAQISRSNP